MTKGRFIAFEGLDGSGESTQASLLSSRLRETGRKVLQTKEPTNNLVGGLIRAALTHQWKPSNQVIQLLYAADRGHHLEWEIIPTLAKGYDVIADRYYYSSIAFGSLDADPLWLEELNRYYPEPDIVFYIKVRASVAMERMEKSRPHKELFEEEAKLAKVAKTYNQLAIRPIFRVIDGEQSPDKVHEDIWNHLNSLT